jgi:hypothetical protein
MMCVDFSVECSVSGRFSSVQFGSFCLFVFRFTSVQFSIVKVLVDGGAGNSFSDGCAAKRSRDECGEAS